MELTTEQLSSSQEIPTTVEPGSIQSSEGIDGFWVTFAAVLPLLGLLPMLFVEAIFLWNRAHYRYVPLALLALLTLIFLHFRPAAPDKTRVMAGAILTGLAGLFGVASVYFFIPTLAHLAVTLLLCGWLLGQLGETRISRVLALTLLLASTIPLPWGLDTATIGRLQDVAGGWTSGALDAMGILHLHEGQWINSRFFQLPTTRVGGGPDSVFLLFSFAAILVAARRHGTLAAAIMLLSVPLWFLCYGTLSQLILAVYADGQQVTAPDLPVLPVRIGVLILVGVAMILFDVATSSLLRPAAWSSSVEDQWLEEEETLAKKPPITETSKVPFCRFISIPAAAAMFLSGLLATYMIATNSDTALSSTAIPIASLANIAVADTLPESLQEWQRSDYQASMVQVKDGGIAPVFDWKYVRGLDRVEFVLNVGQKPPALISDYEQQGWRVVASPGNEQEAGQVVQTPSGVPYRFASLRNSIGQRAFILASEVSTDGQITAGDAQATEESSTFETIFSKLSKDEEQTQRVAFHAHLIHIAVSDLATLPPDVAQIYEQLVARISQKTAAGFGAGTTEPPTTEASPQVAESDPNRVPN